MERNTKYWVPSLMRVIVAILEGIDVLVLPQAITLVFLLPFGMPPEDRSQLEFVL
jgi:hypothetical protein